MSDRRARRPAGPARFGGSGALRGRAGLGGLFRSLLAPGRYAPGEVADLPRSVYGFPVVPGLLAAAVRPFVAAGLQTPWLTVFGNHDGLLQGAIAEIPAFGSIATGADKIIGLAPDTNLQLLFSELLASNPAVLALLVGGPTRQVTADPDRRLLTRAQVVQEHFNTTGYPRGHSYTSQNVANGTAYYTFGRGAIRFIVMDTVNQGGGPNGSLDRQQFGCSSSSRAAAGTSMRPASWSGSTPGTSYSSCSAITRGGFWEVNTAAHIDWPQQSRLVEIADNRDGPLSVIVTIVDTAAPPSHGGRLSGPLDLASLSRELGLNDWQAPQPAGGVDGRRGSVQDRNAELIVPAPSRIAAR